MWRWMSRKTSGMKMYSAHKTRRWASSSSTWTVVLLREAGPVRSLVQQAKMMQGLSRRYYADA